MHPPRPTDAHGPDDSRRPAVLTSDLTQAARSFGVTLTVVPSDFGVILEGMARTYYGKQMAQELARQANFVVAANHIVVEHALSPQGASG